MKWTTLTAALLVVAGSSIANAGLFKLHRHSSCDSAPSCAAPCGDACGAAGPSCAAPAGCGNGCGNAAPTCAAPAGCGNGCGNAAPSCCAPAAACCAPAPADCCAPSCCSTKKCHSFGSLLKKCRLPKMRCRKSSCCGAPSNCCAPSCAAPAGCGNGNGCGNAAPTCAAPCGPTCAAPCGACN